MTQSDDFSRQPLTPTWDEKWRFKKWLEFCQKPHADWPDDGRLIHAAFEAGIDAVIPILDAYARASFRYSDELAAAKAECERLEGECNGYCMEIAALQSQPGEVRLVPTGERRKPEVGEWCGSENLFFRSKTDGDYVGEHDIYRRIVGPEGL